MSIGSSPTHRTFGPLEFQWETRINARIALSCSQRLERCATKWLLPRSNVLSHSMKQTQRASQPHRRIELSRHQEWFFSLSLSFWLIFFPYFRFTLAQRNIPNTDANVTNAIEWREHYGSSISKTFFCSDFDSSSLPPVRSLLRIRRFILWVICLGRTTMEFFAFSLFER